MRPWVLSEVTYRYVKDHPYEVALLPLGATEPHNLHLPYGTDCFEATTLGERLCRSAHEQGASIALLPTIPYGTETNMRRFPLAMNINPSTLYQIVTDLVHSLSLAGIRKLVMLNSHGGNELKPLMRELYGQTDVHLFLCNWYQILGDEYDEIFTHRDDHAGEMETSFMLAFHGDLVAFNEDGSLAADAGSPRPTRFEAIERKSVSIARPWHLLTTNTGCGNPHEATAAKGEQLMHRLEERLVPFLVQLSKEPLDEAFPFVAGDRDA